MKILCALSGIKFNCDHFPASIETRESFHPIFHIQQKSLLQYARKWSSHELTDTDSYLYYLALLHSTGLVQNRTSAIMTPSTKSIVANNMEYLLRTISKINLVTHPSFVLHRIMIDANTRDLSNSRSWIDNWNDSYDSFSNGYRKEIAGDKLKTRESKLEKLIKDQNKPIEMWARHLADWAADAGEFPESSTTVNGKQMTLANYWRHIIICCTTDDRIFAIREADLKELIEYCEENIDAGSIYGYNLFSLLRSGLQKQAGYLGFDDLDIAASGFTIMQPKDSKEDAARMVLIKTAPAETPVESAYPTKLAFLRAKLAYSAAQNYAKEQAMQEAIQAHTRKKLEDSEAQSPDADDSNDNLSEEDI